jgi:hypothetical protein
VRIIEKTSPKAVTAPSGPHRVEPEAIIGITPTAAAMEVRKIGRMRRLPAARAASKDEIPRAQLVGVAHQDDAVAHHDAHQSDDPMKAVMQNGYPGGTTSPSAAPNSDSGMVIMIRMDLRNAPELAQQDEEDQHDGRDQRQHHGPYVSPEASFSPP